jgi:hypothetical protein
VIPQHRELISLLVACRKDNVSMRSLWSRLTIGLRGRDYIQSRDRKERDAR